MKKMLVVGSWLLVTALAYAGERSALWPEGRIPNFQPQQIAATTQEMKASGFKEAEHSMPHLDWYEAPAKKNGAYMLLISGGGYQNCFDGVWIHRVAQKLTVLGYVCVNLTYRTPRPKGLPIYQSAWEDGQRAVRLVRSEAQKRGFDPEEIGALGFSAGSHLGGDEFGEMFWNSSAGWASSPISTRGSDVTKLRYSADKRAQGLFHPVGQIDLSLAGLKKNELGLTP